MKCSKTGLTDQDYKTILDVLNMYDPNDIAHVVPEMATPQFMLEVQSAFRAVLAHVNRTKYGSDMGAVDGDPKRHADELDDMDYAEAATQRYREDRIKELATDMPSAEPSPLERAAYDQYIHGLS